MKHKKAVEFCKTWLNAWTGNKPEKLITFYSKNCYYQDPANPEGIRGREKLRTYLKKLFRANPNWEWNLMELYPTEKGFVFKWKAKIPIKNEVLIEYGIDIVEIKNQKILRNEVYFDRSRLQRLVEEEKS